MCLEAIHCGGVKTISIGRREGKGPRYVTSQVGQSYTDFKISSLANVSFAV
jgi:hypothetical protein